MCVQFDAGPVHELFFFAFFMNTSLYWYFYDITTYEVKPFDSSEHWNKLFFVY